MKKCVKMIISILLVFSMLLTGLPGGNLNGVFAEGEKPVQLGINGSKETSGYNSIEEAVNAIDAQVKENAANKNNTYEIYLDKDSGFDYVMPAGDYTFPEVKLITFHGGINDLGGNFYTRVGLGFSGNLEFLSDVEFVDVQLVRLKIENVSVTAKNIYISGDVMLGTHDYEDWISDTFIEVNCEKFYSCSSKVAQIIEAGNCANVDELLTEIENAGEEAGSRALELVNIALNAEDCYGVGVIKLREGRAVSSHIKNYHAINTQDNEWQGADSKLHIMEYTEDIKNEMTVSIDNLIIEYMKCNKILLVTPYGDCTGKVEIGDIAIDKNTSTVESVSMLLTQSHENGAVEDKINLYFTGQMSDISEICYEFIDGYESSYYSNWRDYFVNEDGTHRFSCFHIEEQENTPKMKVYFYTNNGSGYCKISKNDSEYYMDFDAPLMDIWDFEEEGYVQYGDFFYKIEDDYLNGDFFERNPEGVGQAYPIYYIGESTTLSIPKSIEYEGHTYNVTLYYAMDSLKANVEKMYLPTTDCPSFDLTHIFFERINNYLPGGAESSALREYEVDENHPIFSTDEEGNLYSKNGAVLYSVPPAKTSYSFPDTVTKIARNAFSNSHVKELVIPETVQIIDNAFKNMKDLEKVVFTGSEPIDFRDYTDFDRDSVFDNCGNFGTIVYGAESTGAKDIATRAGFCYEADATVYGSEKDYVYEKIDDMSLGDVNRDEETDANDALLILKVVAKLENYTPGIKKAGDVNFSGQMDADDALGILKKVACMIDEFEDTVEGIDAHCKIYGHNYSVVKEASYEETGEKKCDFCDNTMSVPKKNPAYICSCIELTGQDTMGKKTIYDIDAGEIIKEISVETLLGTEAPDKVWILGDSIAAAHDKEGYERPLYGWGEVIGNYYTDDVTFVNKAKSSQSSKSFVGTQEYSAALGNGENGVADGDYVIISFGHNDHNTTGGTSRVTDPETGSDVEGSFKWYLKNKYIEPVLARGAVPILMSPVCRCSYKWQGKFKEEEVHLKYAKAMKELIEEYEKEGILIYYIDAQEYTYKLYSGLTRKQAMEYHGLGHPSWGEWYEDTTHYSLKGATMISEYIVECMKKLPLGMNAFLKE